MHGKSHCCSSLCTLDHTLASEMGVLGKGKSRGLEQSGKAPCTGVGEDGLGAWELFKEDWNLVKHLEEDSGGENFPRKDPELGISWVWLDNEE